MTEKNISFKQRLAINVERIHQTATIVALVLLPLSGLPAKIGFFILCAGLFRLPTTARILSSQIRTPLFVLFVAWWVVAVLSATWSSHPNQSMLANPLLVLIIPALGIAIAKPRPYILALSTGVLIHTGIQLITWLGIVEVVNYNPMTISGGLHWYPPFTALWSTTALLLLLGLILTSKSWKHRLVPLLLAIPLPLSLVLAGNRTLFLVIPFAIVVLVIRLITISSTRRRRIAVLAVCSAIIIVAIGSLLVPGTMPNQRIVRLIKDVSSVRSDIVPQQSGLIHDTSEVTRRRRVDQYTSSYGLRYVWWRAGFEIWKEAPWIGHGTGSSFDQFALQEAKLPTEYGADVEGFITPEPHSSILATAIEQGLLGITLMASLALLALVHAWKCAVATPLLAGLGATWFTVTIFSFAHTLQFADYTTSLVAILVAFTLCLKPPEQKASQTSAEIGISSRPE